MSPDILCVTAAAILCAMASDMPPKTAAIILSLPGAFVPFFPLRCSHAAKTSEVLTGGTSLASKIQLLSALTWDLQKLSHQACKTSGQQSRPCKEPSAAFKKGPGLLEDMRCCCARMAPVAAILPYSMSSLILLAILLNLHNSRDKCFLRSLLVSVFLAASSNLSSCRTPSIFLERFAWCDDSAIAKSAVMEAKSSKSPSAARCAQS